MSAVVARLVDAWSAVAVVLAVVLVVVIVVVVFVVVFIFFFAVLRISPVAFVGMVRSGVVSGVIALS